MDHKVLYLNCIFGDSLSFYNIIRIDNCFLRLPTQLYCPPLVVSVQSEGSQAIMRPPMLFPSSPGGLHRRGERAVDSSCTNGDLLCFALHMIMIDSGYQPNVSCLLTPSQHSSTLPSRPQSPSLTHTLHLTSLWFSITDSLCLGENICDLETSWLRVEGSRVV